MADRTRPLRFKLTIWFVGVFLLIQGILLAAIIVARRDSIERSHEQALQRHAEDMVENILAAGAEFTRERIHPLMPKEAGFRFWVVRSTQGLSLADWNLRVDSQTLFSKLENVETGPVGPVFWELKAEAAQLAVGEGVPLEIVTIPFRKNDAQFFFQAGVRYSLLERLLGPYQDLFLIGVPVGLVAAFVAAWLIAGRVVAPIHDLSEAARGVSPRSLGERIRVTSTDQEIRRLQDELNLALERLEHGYRAQEEFIANVSHELKTPIAVLLTEAQVARLGEQSEGQHRLLIEKVEREMQRLGRLVESFLTLARAELTKTHALEPLSVNDVVVEAVRIFGSVAESRGRRLISYLADPADGEPEPMVRGDADLLRTMIENLLSNAIRHSPEGGSIDVSVECVGSSVLVSVRDRGPGVPPEYVDKIFDRFFQAPSRAGRKDGSGLGLAIASHVARLHEGAIRARNEPDGGCTFVVELPLAAPQVLAQADLPKHRRPGHSERAPAPY